MINERLVHIRKIKGWTQSELAERSGYSRSSIINWETGKRAPRTIDIEQLAATLGVLPSDLIDDSPIEPIHLQAISELNNMKNQDNKFAYWGGVLDKALKVADSKDIKQIMLIIPLLKSALNALLSVQAEVSTDKAFKLPNTVINQQSISGGQNNNNGITIGAVPV